VDGNPVRQTIQKIDSRGLARCEVCNKEINYAGRGWKSLEQHLKKKLHIDNLKIKRTNYSLSVMYHCIPSILSFLQGRRCVLLGIRRTALTSLHFFLCPNFMAGTMNGLVFNENLQFLEATMPNFF
jgi:hypothetical protein